MLKKFLTIAIILTGFVFVAEKAAVAQEKTAAELKAERDALKTEIKSQETTDREAKIAALTPPKTSGVKSVDDLATSTGTFLVAAKANTPLIKNMYTRTIGETMDGVTDVTVKKPSLKELTDLSANISTQIADVQKASTAVQAASEDIKKASPLQAGKATKALNYTKDALGMLGPELQLNLKSVNHLITTVKSTKNY